MHRQALLRLKRASAPSASGGSTSFGTEQNSPSEHGLFVSQMYEGDVDDVHRAEEEGHTLMNESPYHDRGPDRRQRFMTTLSEGSAGHGGAVHQTSSEEDEFQIDVDDEDDEDDEGQDDAAEHEAALGENVHHD